MSGLTVVGNEIYAGDCVDFSIHVFSATGDPLRTIPVPSGWTQPTAALCWAENTLYIVEYCVKDMGYLPTSDDPPPRGFTPAGHPYPTKLGPQAAAAGCGVIALTPEGVVKTSFACGPRAVRPKSTSTSIRGHRALLQWASARRR